MGRAGSSPASDTTQWEDSHESTAFPVNGPLSRPGALEGCFDGTVDEFAPRFDEFAPSINGASARGRVGETVTEVTPTPPPLIARHGTLRARPGSTTSPLPVRPGAPRRGGPAAAAPLARFVAPSVPDPVLAFRSARLDRGRLHAPDAVAAAGLEVLSEFEACLAGTNRLRLRRRASDDRAVRSTSRPHVDATGRIVLSAGLRRHLGVESDGCVVLWAEPGEAGASPGVLVIAHPEILVVALVAAEQATRPAMTAEVGS